MIGGATAEGLSENIRSAYTFIANKSVSLLLVKRRPADEVLEAMPLATKYFFLVSLVELSRHAASQASLMVLAC